MDEFKERAIDREERICKNYTYVSFTAASLFKIQNLIFFYMENSYFSSEHSSLRQMALKISLVSSTHEFKNLAKEMSAYGWKEGREKFMVKAMKLIIFLMNIRTMPIAVLSFNKLKLKSLPEWNNK